MSQNDRFYFGDLGNGIYRLIVCLGFAEDKSRVMEFLRLASIQYPKLSSLLQEETGLIFYTGAVKVEPKGYVCMLKAQLSKPKHGEGI